MEARASAGPTCMLEGSFTLNRTNLRGIITATATFVATAGVVAGIAKGVERFTADDSAVHATFATDVPRTAAELESWRRAVLAGDDTKRELEAAAREIAEEKRRQAIEEKRRAEEAQRRKAEEEKRRKAEEEKARKEAEARKKAEEEARQRAEKEARKEAEAKAEERREAEAAAKKKEEKAARKGDSGSSGGSTKAARSASTGSPKAIGRELVAAKGWSSGQFACLEKLWTRESNWRVNAQNPSSGAYGIPQALPGSKMATFGSDWRTNPRTQIKWGLSYIAERYGTPCGAWSAFQSKGWY